MTPEVVDRLIMTASRTAGAVARLKSLQAVVNCSAMQGEAARSAPGTRRYRIGRRTVQITSPDRVLFPDDGITKADLAEYHHRMAGVLVPHLVDRPLMLQRFPEGISAKGFYQKEAGRGVPAWIRTVEVDKEGGVVRHPVVDDMASLLALTNLSVVSFHRWPTRADRLDHPDLLMIDLDPSTDDFDDVVRAAHWTRDLLDELELAPYLLTTGSRGLHVVVPLDRSADTATVAAFAHTVGRLLAVRHPDDLTDETRKSARGRRLYLDTARNGWAQTAIAPYSVRPRGGAPVATPITWDELDDSGLRPDGWTVTTVPGRVASSGDPWSGMARHARSLGLRRERLDELLEQESGRATRQ